MTALHQLLPRGRGLLLLDVLLAGWAALWVVVGILVAINVAGLRDLSATVRVTGDALEKTGATLRSLGEAPFVPDDVGETAAEIEQAGGSAVSSGRSSREHIETLSWLLGIAVAVIPSIPVLGFYVPLRLALRRESEALRGAARRGGEDPAFEEFLARRALQTLSYHSLSQVSNQPWRDLAEGRHGALARAELERLDAAR